MNIEAASVDLNGSWVYVLGTSSDRERAKIGITKNNPILRFSFLRCADPGLYICAAFFIPNGFELSAREIEKAVHHKLRSARIKFHNDGNSEWFWHRAELAKTVCGGYIDEFAQEKGRSLIAFSSESYYLDKKTPLIASESDLELFFGKPRIWNEGELPW